MTDITDVIAELAKDIYRTLGSGHSEAAYQKAMEVGLRLQHVRFEAQKVIELTYQNHYIGEENIDLLVESNSQEVIVDDDGGHSGRGQIRIVEVGDEPALLLG